MVGKTGNSAAWSMMRMLLSLGLGMLVVVGYVHFLYLPQKQAIEEHHEEMQSLRRELKNLRQTRDSRERQRNEDAHDLLKQRLKFLESLVRGLDPKVAKEIDDFAAVWSTTTRSSLASTTLVSSVAPDQSEEVDISGTDSDKSQRKEKGRKMDFREDYKCGTSVPGSEGTLVGCNPEGKAPCCSQGGWCGASANHCECDGCKDYRSHGKGNQEFEDTSYREDIPKSIALVVPFRDRGSHLEKFREKVEALVEYWNKRHVKHTWMVFIVDQFDNELFNRGWLFNVGFKQAMAYAAERGFTFDCVVMHDVDILPTPNVDYGWCSVPNQLSGEIECWANSVPYEESTGGVISLSPQHWVQINGFSNEYHGWGGEDDDLYSRLKQNHLLRGSCHKFCSKRHPAMVHRPALGKGRFTCLNDGDHTPRQRNHDDSKMWKRLNDMKANSQVWKTDGISDLSIHSAGVALQSPACENECEAPEDPKPRKRLFGEHWARVSMKPIADATRIRVMLPPSHTCANESVQLATIPVGIQHMRRLLPDLFEKTCGVTEDWAVQQNFVLIDGKLGQSVLVGSGAPVVVPDVALPLVEVSGAEPKKRPEREQEFVVQSERLNKWMRKLPADHIGYIVIADAPLPKINDRFIKKDRRYPLTVPVCIAKAATDIGGKKYRATPGTQWCGDGGWTSTEYFTALRSKSSIVEDKLIPVCIAYNTNYYTYRYERSEIGCAGTHKDSGTEWIHAGTFHTSKDATGDEVCVGIIQQGARTRWIIRKARDCNVDGFSHTFGFRAMMPKFEPPIIHGCLLSARSKAALEPLSRYFAGSNCSGEQETPAGYTTWWHTQDLALLARRHDKSDRRLCFATAEVKENDKSFTVWRMLENKLCDSSNHSAIEKTIDGQLLVSWRVHPLPKMYSPIQATGPKLCICRGRDTGSLIERLMYNVSMGDCEAGRHAVDFCFSALSGADLVKSSYLLDEPS